MDESEFWITQFRVALIGLCVLVMTFAGCQVTQQVVRSASIKGLVANGADPIKASCAIDAYQRETETRCLAATR